MDSQTLDKIERLKKAISASTDPDIIASLQKKLTSLEADVAKAESVVEKKEEKILAEEKKAMDDNAEKLERLKKALAASTDPDVKAQFQKKIDSLKSSVAEKKQEIAAEKKEIAEEKKEVKEAAKQVEKIVKKVEVAEKKQEEKGVSDADDKIKRLEKAIAAQTDEDVKNTLRKRLKELKEKVSDVKKEIKEEKKPVRQAKPQKVVRKNPIKKAAPAPAPKKEERKKKLKGVLAELDALIEKNRRLKAKYGTSYKGTGKPSDLERDSKRKAKPFGYRFVGKHNYRVPTEMEIKKGLKRGTIDYEGRPNRADVSVKRKVKLEDGGMMAKGGNVDKFIRNYMPHAIKHSGNSKEGYTVLIEDKKSKSKMWVDVYIADNDVRADWNQNIFDKDEDDILKKNLQGNTQVFEDATSEAINYLEDKKLIGQDDKAKWYYAKKQDGGMMAKGGNLPKRYEVGIDEGELGTKTLADFESKSEAEIFLREYKAKNPDSKLFIDSITSDFSTMAKGGKTKEKWIQDALAGKKGVLRATAKKKGLLRGDENLSKTDLKKLQKVGGKTAKRAHLAETLSKFKKGGKVGNSDEDKARFAKPAGWRWKEEAFKKGFITRTQLAQKPSKYMRDKYPTMVYYEDRLNKSDKKPTRTSAPSV
jgi:hypothetical protein